MGFGREELLLGGRLFPILDNLTEREFKVFRCRSFHQEKLSLLQITHLRLDFHKQSSIASSRCVFNLDQQKIKDDQPSGAYLLIQSIWIKQ